MYFIHFSSSRRRLYFSPRRSGANKYGVSQSFPAANDSRPITQRERSDCRTQTTLDLNEKFQAVRMDDFSALAEGLLLETGHVSRAKAEEYVRQLLKDPKNRLGLSALSTNNPSQVCIEVAIIVGV